MTSAFKDWIEQTIPNASVEGSVVCIEAKPSDPFVYECCICGDIFKSTATYAEVEMEECTADSEFVCDDCFRNRGE